MYFFTSTFVSVFYTIYWVMNFLWFQYIHSFIIIHKNLIRIILSFLFQWTDFLVFDLCLLFLPAIFTCCTGFLFWIVFWNTYSTEIRVSHLNTSLNILYIFHTPFLRLFWKSCFSIRFHFAQRYFKDLINELNSSKSSDVNFLLMKSFFWYSLQIYAYKMSNMAITIALPYSYNNSSRKKLVSKYLLLLKPAHGSSWSSL